ncbi:YbgA family protein [Thalassotalea euphylliae]|uniref:YbgA family protein n=1 Tax=Thalassotalea euphylliae TaxID=1655234 RepID=UPI003640AAEE
MNDAQLSELGDITLGISACVAGENVRFDSSSKTSHFCMKELGNYVKFKPVCPEVAVGLPVPRPTIRQIRKDDVITVSRPDGSGDVTEALAEYGKKIGNYSRNLSGFIFCAKSPSCGMERVKVYSEDGKGSTSDGVGVFAREVMKANPLLPCEENGRLNDAIIRENFVARVYAYRKWQLLEASGLSKHKLTTFHSQFKYTVMSHDLIAYKELGQLLARADLPLEEMAEQYIHGLMAALTIKATRKKHANTLQHIQGYFAKELNSDEKQELCEQIEEYRKGLVPLFVPLTLIRHHLRRFPKDYLKKQFYLAPYPAELKLRYGM